MKKHIRILNVILILTFMAGIAASCAGKPESGEKETASPGNTAATESEETGQETQSEPETVDQTTETSGVDEAPLALTYGNVRMLCHARLNDFEKEIIKRFNESREDQIELVYAPFEYEGGEYDPWCYWEAAIEEDVDLYWVSGNGEAWLFGLHGLLTPLDRLIGDRLEKGDYLEQVLDACRYQDNLMILPAFFDASSFAVPRTIYEKDPEAFGSSARYLELLRSLPDQDFWLGPEVGSSILGMYGGEIDYENFTADFQNEEFAGWLAVEEYQAAYRATHEDPYSSDPEKRQNRRVNGFVSTSYEKLSREFFTEGAYGEKGGVILPLPGETGSELTVMYGVAVAQNARNPGTIRDFLTFLLSDEIMRLELDAPPMSPYANPQFCYLPLEGIAFRDAVARHFGRYGDQAEEELAERREEIETILRRIDGFAPQGFLYEALIEANKEIREKELANTEEVAACLKKYVDEALSHLREGIEAKKASLAASESGARP